MESDRLESPGLNQAAAMQQDDVEVQFCDLCGTSVPLADLESGAAVRHEAKTIGGCCLAVLRQGDSPLASPGISTRASAAARNEQGLLPIAIALFVAVTAATIFLDYKIQGIADRQLNDQTVLTSSLRAGSDVLQGIDQAMDGAARKSDLDALTEKITALGAELEVQAVNARQQEDQLRVAIAAVRADAKQVAEQRIDYRPLFDDLRAKLQQQAIALADLRIEGPAAPPVDAAAPREATEDGPDPATGLSAELAAQVTRLADGDAAVRFEAVDQLLISKSLDVLPHLLPMTRDADGFVRRLTVEGLRDFPHRDSVEALLEALGDGDSTVADTAWSSLKKLTGQKIPFDAAAPSKDARTRAQQRWREWWQKNKATFGS